VQQVDEGFIAAVSNFERLWLAQFSLFNRTINAPILNGTCDGANTEFAVDAFITGTTEVSVNGVLLTPAVDYTLVGVDRILLNEPPSSESTIRIDYNRLT
jgi:hypothetical protein